MKIRTIITQDAEVDDQNSLRHFLFYCNEVELQGIVQTSSKFHWKGIPGAKKTGDIDSGNFMSEYRESDEYEKPYRWPGTDWMMEVIDDYEKDYPNLCRHADGYPTPDYLRSITKVGNIGYVGEMDAPSEGSELIRKAILDSDERTLYLQVWGGCNTIARALQDIQAEYEGTPDWETLHGEISEKIVITACGEQDGTFRSYIAENWPKIPFIKTLQMRSYAYPWFTMPECESKDTLKADFMKAEILREGSALAKGYCTWLDGTYYEGEEQQAQFGANPNIANEWFGARMGMKYIPNRYDFLSEGDSPTFFAMFDFGMRTLEDFSYGGMAGRYAKVAGEVNSRGEALDVWDVAKDHFTGNDGQEQLLESMWPYVADIQRSFASRVNWACTEQYADAEHDPSLSIEEGVDLTAKPGQTISLHAKAGSPDGAAVAVSFRVYADASAECAKQAILNQNVECAELTIPEGAVSGDKIHVIVKAQAGGHYRLVHYQHVIITVE